MCKVAPRIGEGAAPSSVEHDPKVAKNGGEVTLKRELGLFSAINVVLNCMIGKYLLTFYNFLCNSILFIRWPDILPFL